MSLASHVLRHALEENVATITATLAWGLDLTLGGTTFDPDEVRCNPLTDGLTNGIGYLPLTRTRARPERSDLQPRGPAGHHRACHEFCSSQISRARRCARGPHAPDVKQEAPAPVLVEEHVEIADPHERHHGRRVD